MCSIYCTPKGAHAPMTLNSPHRSHEGRPQTLSSGPRRVALADCCSDFRHRLFRLGGREGEGRRQAGLTIAGLPTIGIHMILGLLVLVLLIVRLVIRLTTRHPEWATAGNRFLDIIGVITHWGLYIFTFAITITGLILAIQTNRLNRVFNPSSAAAGGFAARQLPPGQVPPSGSLQPGQVPPSAGSQPGQSPRTGQFPCGVI